MSRTSKKETHLTIEEALNQALVPDVEQPYKIPKNWTWCYLQSFSDISTGKKDANYGSKDGKYYFFTCAADPIRSNGYSFEGKYILLAGNGNISNIQIYDGKFEAYQRTYVLSVNPDIYTEFVYYYFKYRWVDYNIDKTYGTAIPYIRLGNLQFFPVPIASLAEQQRIVDRIENLFTKLDEAKEKAQEVIDGFDDRRSAILNKAFTGELTQAWRKLNNITTDSWSNKSINSICHSLKYGTAKKSESSGSVVVIRMGNLQQGEIDWNDLAYTTDKADIEKYLLKQNDVLFNRTNSAALVGKTSIYRGEYPAIYAGYLIKLDYNHEIVIGDYLNYALNTQNAKIYCNSVKTDGVNQSNINAKKIGAFFIPVPSIKEQEIIVEKVKRLLSKEQQAKETAEQVIEQIEVMKEAILARAFRGELGTNDPNDESAIELLKRVLSDESTKESEPKPTKKRITIPKELSKQLGTAMERKIIRLYFEMDTDVLSLDDIFSVSSKKLDVLDCIRTLEKKQIIIQEENGKYRLVR